MAIGNNVELTGNITSDIDLRITRGGTSVAKFGLAWNRRWQQDGEWQEEPHFFDITVFGEQADNVAESFAKGSRVIVIGRLDQNRWEDKESGQNRSKVAVVADEVAGSAKFATLEMTKTHNTGRDQPRGGRPAERSGGARGGAERARDDYGDSGRGGARYIDNEEPF
jgi:single-strand DNA-binding protein